MITLIFQYIQSLFEVKKRIEKPKSVELTKKSHNYQEIDNCVEKNQICNDFCISLKNPLISPIHSFVSEYEREIKDKTFVFIPCETENEEIFEKVLRIVSADKLKQNFLNDNDLILVYSILRKRFYEQFPDFNYKEIIIKQRHSQEEFHFHLKKIIANFCLNFYEKFLENINSISLKARELKDDNKEVYEIYEKLINYIDDLMIREGFIEECFIKFSENNNIQGPTEDQAYGLLEKNNEISLSEIYLRQILEEFNNYYDNNDLKEISKTSFEKIKEIFHDKMSEIIEDYEYFSFQTNKQNLERYYENIFNGLSLEKTRVRKKRKNPL